MLIPPMPKYMCDKCGLKTDAIWVIDHWELPSDVDNIWREYVDTGPARKHCCPACHKKEQYTIKCQCSRPETCPGPEKYIEPDSKNGRCCICDGVRDLLKLGAKIKRNPDGSFEKIPAYPKT